MEVDGHHKKEVHDAGGRGAPDHVVGRPFEGLACTDLVPRTPIGMSRNFWVLFFHLYNRARSTAANS